MNAPRRSSRFVDVQKFMGPESDWALISRRIKEGTVIPIIGNAFFGDRIFEQFFADDNQANQDQSQPALTVDELLAGEWANAIQYPLADYTSLARVALYNRVLRHHDAEEANRSYLRFLKGVLLAGAQNSDPRLAAAVAELGAQIEEKSFSDMVQELDYPQFPAGQENPLRLLARLPLPIYITTSFYDFLERALVAEGRQPFTQVCFWTRQVVNPAPEHVTDYNFAPSEQRPLVYHLFGFEKYPATMVLSEADYLDFLLRITQDTDKQNPIIPLYLSGKLSSSSLVLAGYRLQDWDFRVLYRIVRDSPLHPFSMLVQIDPRQMSGISDSDEARKYLEEYLHETFKIQWSNPNDFVNQLWEEWNKWRQGQQ
jgi:hypothetical protein